MQKINGILNQRGDSEIGGIIILAIIGLILFGFFGISFGIENEGTVKYDDCRQEITLNDGDWQTYTKKFTCTYKKTKSGAMMGGECVHIVNDSSLFSSSHTCATAYVYEKKQEDICTDPIYPYLTYDDKCSSKRY